MGVPYYFKYLTTNISDCVLPHIHNIPTVLYLDFNSIIYEARTIVCRQEKYIGCKKIILEYAICEEVIRLLTKIVDSIGAYKLHTIYIAIDGVAPMAKMVQQQQRRFKSAFETELIKNIAKEENIADDKVSWDSNAITPGTKFMERLINHLDGFICYIKLLCPELECILDSSKNPGEGEHKLFRYMDIHKEEHTSLQKVIYGLDADLIVLSILRGYERMYLYREASYYPFKLEEHWEYLYMDVGVLRKTIVESYWIDNLMDNEQRCVTDYVFLTFLLGNDFIPNVFILRIQKGGFEKLNELYRQGFFRFKCHLISKDFRIHGDFFRYILEGLYRSEDIELKDLAQDFAKFRPRLNPNQSEYEKRVEMVNFYPNSVGELDTIQLGEDGWRERFYEYWLDCKPDSFMIDGMVANYIEGLHWILKYYLIGCPDWLWFYKFPVAPCLKDLLAFMRKNKDRYLQHEFTISNVDEDYNLLQLALVLPKSSSKCVPKYWRHIVNHNNLWYLHPNQFVLKTLYKKYYHDCVAILPKINENVLDVIKNLKKRLSDIVVIVQ